MKQSEKKQRLKVFQERLDLLREERNLNNTDFAKYLEMSRQTIGFYLNGDRVPDALNLIKIAQKCGVSADWLLGLTDTRSQDTDIRGICEKTGLSERAAGVLIALGSEKPWDHDGILSYIDTINKLIGWPDFILLLRQLRRVEPYSAGVETIAEQALPIFDKIASFDREKNSSSIYNQAAAIFLAILKLRNDIRVMRFNVIDTFTNFVDELCDSPNYKKWEQKFNEAESDSKLMRLMDDKIAGLGGCEIDISELVNETQLEISNLNDLLE